MIGYNNFKRTGFTLGEVLITLAIIGVIAVMTVPPLIMNHQKKVSETQLQKVYSLTVNACERMLSEENASTVNETELYSTKSNDVVKKYFKTQKTGTTYETNGFTIYLADSSVLNLTNSGNGFKFNVDINGVNTKPNKNGVDIFEYILDENCNYTSAGTSDAASAFDTMINNNFKL